LRRCIVTAAGGSMTNRTRLARPICRLQQAVEKGSGECETRREAAKLLSPPSLGTAAFARPAHKSAVYMRIHEHFEPLRNDISRGLSAFQRPASDESPIRDLEKAGVVYTRRSRACSH